MENLGDSCGSDLLHGIKPLDYLHGSTKISIAGLFSLALFYKRTHSCVTCMKNIYLQRRLTKWRIWEG